jgi:hypothetical protein
LIGNHACQRAALTVSDFDQPDAEVWFAVQPIYTKRDEHNYLLQDTASQTRKIC